MQESEEGRASLQLSILEGEDDDPDKDLQSPLSSSPSSQVGRKVRERDDRRAKSKAQSPQRQEAELNLDSTRVEGPLYEARASPSFFLPRIAAVVVNYGDLARDQSFMERCSALQRAVGAGQTKIWPAVEYAYGLSPESQGGTG
ncbi:hypothetical protein KM043_018341 [Ampulex compressa]|nr:hypothetical protein KM043_018341 [Ampulex compressa]